MKDLPDTLDEKEARDLPYSELTRAILIIPYQAYQANPSYHALFVRYDTIVVYFKKILNRL